MRHGHDDVIELQGVRIRPSRAASEFIEGRIRSGKYERREFAALQRILRPDDRVLELGAGLGFLSTWCAQRIGSERVAAYEPNPALEPAIREAYRMNDVAPTLVMSAVGIANGIATLSIGDEFWTATTVDSLPDAAQVRVLEHDIVDVILEHQPTVVVMDIEGAERDVLPAMLDVHPNPVRAVVIEVHPDVLPDETVARLAEALTSAGFSIECDGPVWECRRPVGDAAPAVAELAI